MNNNIIVGVEQDHAMTPEAEILAERDRRRVARIH